MTKKSPLELAREQWGEEYYCIFDSAIEALTKELYKACDKYQFLNKADILEITGIPDTEAK